MPRGGGYYGRYYQGGFGDEEDPLAAAIQGLMGGAERGYAFRTDIEDRKLRAAQDDADRQFRREQFDYNKQQDAARAAERDQDRQDVYAERMRDAGVMPTPGGPSPFVMGPSKRERELTLESAIKDKLERPELEAAAKAYGIPTTNADNATLRVAIQQAEATATARAKPPVRGTPEYEAMLGREAAIEARYRPPSRAGATADAAEVRAARTANRQAQTDYNAMLGRRPRPNQFTDSMTREVDQGAFGDAMGNWRADSTAKAGAVADSRSTLDELLGEPVGRGDGDPRQAAAAEQEQLAAMLNEALADPSVDRQAALQEFRRLSESINRKYGIRVQ